MAQGGLIYPGPTSGDVFIEMHMLWITSDLLVTQVGSLPLEGSQAKDPNGAESPKW